MVCNLGLQFRIADMIRHPDLQLSLRELEALARAFLTVLLSLFDPRIAGNQSGLLQSRPQVRIELNQGPRNAMPDRTRLPGRTAAGNVNNHIKLVCGVRQLQRLANNHSQRLIGKILRKGFTIDQNVAAAGPQINAGSRSLAPSGTVVLNLCHCSFYPLLIQLFVLSDREGGS